MTAGRCLAVKAPPTATHPRRGGGSPVDTHRVSSDVFLASPTPTDVDAVRRISPLAADLFLQCGPFEVPAGVLASVPTLETEQSEAADALRKFLADDPWAGMGSVHPGGWLLPGRDADTIVVGQWQGVIGLGAVATLVRVGGQFVWQGLGGARLVGPDQDELIEPCYSGTEHGTAIDLHWECGQDMAGVVDRTLCRVMNLETSEEVHILLSSIPNPARRGVRAGWHAGTGKTATTTINLPEPLQDRILLDDSHVPAQPVRLQAE